MDKNINYKVYINPNFKGPVNSTNTNYSNNTYINQYYIESNIQKLESYPISGGNRKIYVNPNFLPVRNSSNLEDYHKSREQFSCKINKNLNEAPELDYSLVNNVAKNQNHQQISEWTQSSYQRNISSISQGSNDLNVAPLTRSRYCIVRKKQPIPDAVTKINSHSTLTSTVSDNVQTKSSSSTDKIIKIKISKYKTVPANSYLNKTQVNNEIKLNMALPQVKMTQYANLTLKKPSNFTYIKQNKTPTTNKMTTKPGLKYNVIINKSKWQSNTSKSKLLKANFKINNIPCRLFAKYGKCLRQTYGNCQYLHDKKHVSLCRKFLKGICHDSNCSLSHESTAKKIPTCYFFLKGMCSKENCPYVHIKMSDKVKICQDFLKGYCEKGEKCNFRHIKNTRKQLEINNLKINRNLLNKSIVVKTVKVKKIEREKKLASDKKEEINSTKESDAEHRYYKEMCYDQDSCQTINIKPLRCKLGTLPSYIQL